jgi:hypothetical protein
VLRGPAEPDLSIVGRYARRVNRLDNIVTRNQRARSWQPMTIVKLAIAGFLVVALALAVCTDLGEPKAPARGAPRVDGVLLRAAPK